MTLVYTITQTAPLKLRNRGSLTLPGFTQGKLVDPEVDAYSYHKSADGMNYRLFSPTQGGGWERSAGRGKRPLIVWLYGGGEGGLQQRRLPHDGDDLAVPRSLRRGCADMWRREELPQPGERGAHRRPADEYQDAYVGHWSWIYVARNDPQHHGQHIWQWMASKRLPTGR
jgi:hypothetical protein